MSKKSPGQHSTGFKLSSFTDSCWTRHRIHCCFVSVFSHSGRVRNQHAARSKQQQRHAGGSCLGFSHHPVRKDCTQTGKFSSGISFCIVENLICLLLSLLLFILWHDIILFINVREFFSSMFAKRVPPLVPRECGSGHPDSYPYHPHRAHRGLLPEDQTAGQMLLAAGWCHGQERVYAGKSVPDDMLLTLF